MPVIAAVAVAEGRRGARGEGVGARWVGARWAGGRLAAAGRPVMGWMDDGRGRRFWAGDNGAERRAERPP